MKNNLTEKDIKTINKLAEKYDIKELKINDKEKIFNLKQLCIFDTNIKHIPAAIFKITNLKSLSIYCNNLNRLPKEICDLIKLKELDIISRCLIELPKEIGNLSNIKKLSIYCENLKQLPKEIGDLINLKKLYIYCENLESLPNEIERLTNLEFIRIECENLKQLPKEICNLINLKELSIYCKNLKSLPNEIEKLTNLESIHIESENLKQLPKEIHNLIKLKRFDIDCPNSENFPDGEIVYINNGYDVIPEYPIKHEIKNGRVDILIKSNDKENNEDEENKEKPHCIIIENKLHGAKDEESQLLRYYEACIKDFEVDKIVYLPNLDKKNKPDKQSEEGIPKELIETIIGYNGENKDFHAVLNDSLEEVKLNSNIEWHLLLKHYLKILRLTGETKMDALTEKFYDKIKSEPEEYKKIQLIATMYNDLIKTRLNSLKEEFKGEYKQYWFIKDFYSKRRGINYTIVIDVYADSSYLSLFSREEETANEDNPKSKKKWEQDNKDIEAWLKKHKLFEGFDNGGDYLARWYKGFKFPEEENKLYEFAKKLIECLEEDVESIYNSGK